MSGVRGYVLLPVLLAITVVGVIAYLLSQESGLEVNRSASAFAAQQAEYVVQAGMQHAEWLVGNNNCAGDFSLNNTPLGSHHYSAQAETPATTTTVTTVAPDRDTSVRLNSPDTNFGADIGIDAGLERKGLIHFDLSAITPGSRVVSARLKLYLMTNNPQGSINIHPVTADWSESGATWNNIADSFDAQVMGAIPPQALAMTTVSVNITALVQSWINDGASNHGLMLVDTSATLDSRYGSRENGISGQQPVLEITTADAEVSPVALNVTGTLDSGVSRTLTRDAYTAYQPEFLQVLQPDASKGKDTYLYEWKSTWNYGVSNQIWVDDQFADSTATSLIRFDLGAIPHGARITGARLELYRASPSSSGGPIGVYRIVNDWDEGDRSGGIGASSWNQRDAANNWTSPGGDFTASRYALQTVSAGIGWSSWEIDDLVDGWVSGRFANFGLALYAETAATAAYFASSDATDASLRPKLSITYACACGDACVTPLGSGKVLVVVTDPSALLGSETERVKLIESWGYTVNLIDDDATQPSFDSEIANNDVVYIPASVNAVALGDKLTSSSTGVVNEAGALDAVLGFSSSQSFPAPVGDSVAIVDNNHYITQLFPTGTLKIYSGDMGGHAVAGSLAGGLQPLANWNAGPGLAVLESGAALGGTLDGENAAGRRVGLPFGQDNSFNWARLNNNGRLIMQRAIEWAAVSGVVASTLPIAYWKLDESSGTTAVDSVGGHDGQLRFGPVWAAGKLDGGVLFDGNDDEIKVPHSDTLSLTGAFSFSAWVIADSYAGYNAVLTKGQSGAHNYWFGTQDDEILLGADIEGSFESMKTTGAGLQPGNWYHLAVTHSASGEVRIYLDGSNIFSGSLSQAPLANNASVLIGGSVFSGEVWPGTLDDVRIYDKVLSATEISDLFDLASNVEIYIELNQSITLNTSDSWQVVDLAGYGVPPGSVVEIAMLNGSPLKENYAGIRAVGSSLDRRLLLHEAEAGGSDVIVMHVQAESAARIEAYAESVADVSFTLLGYWLQGSFVEAWDDIYLSTSSAWESIALAAYGVPPDATAELLIHNDNQDAELKGGVRSSGSILERLFIPHEAESGGVDGITMLVNTSSDAGASIEAYSKVNTDLGFYLTGYWSPPPGVFVEAFSDVGRVGSSGQWLDHDLSGFGVPAGSTVSLVLENVQWNAETQLGARSKGSVEDRLLPMQEAESGGSDYASMHVVSDSASTIQLFDENLASDHHFFVLGWWQASP